MLKVHEPLNQSSIGTACTSIKLAWLKMFRVWIPKNWTKSFIILNICFFFLQGVEPLPAAALATLRSERPTCSCCATRSQTQPRSSLLSTSGAPRSVQSHRMLRSSSSDARVISARIVTSSPVWQSPAGLRSRLTRLCPSAARSLPSSTSRPARRRRHVRPFPLLRLPDLLRWEK